MIDTRIFYQKRARIRFLSHLDMNRLMQRALKRAQLPVWFTQGFNPHLYLTFMQPLSLGFESDYEVMDIRLNEPLPPAEVLGRLNAQLPEGLRVFAVAPPLDGPEKIACCDYEIRLPGLWAAPLAAFFAGPVVVEKKTKRGVCELDVRPHLDILTLEERGKDTLLALRCASGPEFSINPALPLGAFCARTGIECQDLSYLKTAVRTADGELFR